MIDRVIRKEFARLNNLKNKDLDHLRHEVKAYFKKRVVDHPTDPTLSQKASYRRMRETLDGLHEADRGNPVEDWYFRRERPDARRHVNYEVNREADGTNEARREQRVADGIEGKKAIEVKDVAGQIDVDQFDAYVTKMKEADKGGPTIEQLVYVFTKPEGAIANLESFAQQFERGDVARRLAISSLTRKAPSFLLSGMPCRLARCYNN